MILSELQQAFAIASKAADRFETPKKEREAFRQIAAHIWKSCGDTRAALVEGAGKVEG